MYMSEVAVGDGDDDDVDDVSVDCVDIGGCVCMRTMVLRTCKGGNKME